MQIVAGEMVTGGCGVNGASGCWFSVSSHDAISAAMVRTLTHLCLSDWQVGAAGARLLAGALGKLRTLSHLALRCNDTGAAGTELLARELRGVQACRR